MRSQPRRSVVAARVCLLLFIFGFQIVSVVRQQSLTWDEGDHIFAGYMSWKTHDYGLNPEHPPLMKMLATAPLLHLPLKVPELKDRFFKEEAYMDGKALLFGNAPAYSAETLTLRVRVASGIVSILLGLLVFLAANEMFGLGAAFLALIALTFEPNLLAHGAYVTTDMGVSCFFFASVYAFYRYCKAPSWPRLVVTGLASGLALASKHSAVLLLPMLVLLAGCEVIFRLPETGEEGETSGHRSLRIAGGFVAAGLIAITVLWMFYGFRYNARPAGLRLDPTLAQYVLPLKPMEAKGILFAARYHLLPESYLYGLADVRAMANGMQSFIFGTVYEHGVWFYFPMVLLIKSTLGWLALVTLALAAVIVGRFRKWREILFLVVPAAVYLLVAMGSSLNIGARHILPVYVFMTVFAAGGCWTWIESGKGWNRGWSWAVGLLLAAHVVSSALAYPNYMAYENELWGGPAETYKYLSDSNADWAQQLLAVKKYTDQHGIKECWMAYFADPFLETKDYGIPCKPLPVYDSYVNGAQHPLPPVITGPVFVSAADLYGFEFGSKILSPYAGFIGLKPVAKIQDGVLVYQGTFAVPLASSLSFVQESEARLKAKDIPGAVEQAQRAVQIAPQGFQGLVALGDALAMSGHPEEAAALYRRALTVADTMEPEAQQVWKPVVLKKLTSLR